jgi:hypothetical protein
MTKSLDAPNETGTGIAGKMCRQYWQSSPAAPEEYGAHAGNSYIWVVITLSHARFLYT